MARDRINYKVNPVLANELASAGGYTVASVALVIIGLHASGRNVHAHVADAYRALASAELPQDIRSALESAIKGIDIQPTYSQHTIDIPSTYERMSELPTNPSYQSDPEDDGDFDDPVLGVGLSV